MKKLLLFDGMAMVYRAYFALNKNPRINSKGMNTSAVLGFVTTIYDFISKQKPSHVAVAFDLQAPTFRHKEYEPYKANREAMPEDILKALPYIHSFLQAMRIEEAFCEGYEADDVIGTLAKKAEGVGFDKVLMITPDKDFAQLVSPGVHLYRLGRSNHGDEEMAVVTTCQKFGVERCKQVADLLGMWGDAIDNIPCIPGVGEKTAKQLIAQFGSVEHLIANSSEIKNPRIKGLVEQYADQALLSKRLATIITDVPIAFDEERFACKTPDFAMVQVLCDELEFRQFGRKFFTDAVVRDPSLADKLSRISAPVQPTADTDAQLSLFGQPQEEHVATEVHVSNLGELLTDTKEVDVSIYVEGATVVVATGADTVYSDLVGNLDVPRLKKMLECSSTVKVCHDLKSLKYILKELGIAPVGRIFDVQLAHYLLNPEARHTLDFIIQEVLGETGLSAEKRAAALWQLYPLLASKLRESGMEQLYWDMELPLVEVLYDMELAGVRIDEQALLDYAGRLDSEKSVIENRIYAEAGGQFNISSTRQLGEVLYEKLHIVEKPPLTATKQYSTSEDVLQKMRDGHPIVDDVLEYRSLNKLINTYLLALPKLVDPSTRRLHTAYNQAVTATGRLSSSNPNLQNVPIRTERGREIRKAFVASDENYVLMAADYSQIELRIIASLSGDEHMCSAFRNNEDIHADTAARIYNVERSAVTSEMRRNAKSVNFGIIYGISSFGLSEQLGVSRKEAAALIEGYFSQYSGIKRYIDSSIEFARSHGYAQTLLGRRRYLSDINSRNATARSFAERNAVNMPIQGTSADMIKLSMVHIFEEMGRLKMRSKMILQVHDELVFDVYRPELDTLRQLVLEKMQQAIPLHVPIEVSIGVGDDWLQAH